MLHLIYLFRRLLFRFRGRVVTRKPRGTARGAVLFSYTTTPYFLPPHQINGHSNYWEVLNMVEAFVERGYEVDVIDFHNSLFIPQKSYTHFLDIGQNMGRLAPLLPPSCKKIFFATGAYWKFQNEGEQKRIEDLFKRRGVHLQPRRVAAGAHPELADTISGVCGPFPTSTYSTLGKPIDMIHVSSSHTFEETSHGKKFLWFGGAGAVHKGLDLVLEAFAHMPERELVVCGKFEGEKDFVDAYKKELHETPNIHTVGYVKPDSEQFKEIAKECCAVISVSASEGTASSVVLAMHAGLIPIVNKETGVPVQDFGVLIESNVEAIQEAVQTLTPTLSRSHDAWEYARTHHTREIFVREFRALLDSFTV
ncbi:glycosyltransferase [Candidatus Parcubacteria bacterium]|nr:glycosyltransferase [Candidatus Parcubacteria bacterium]